MVMVRFEDWMALEGPALKRAAVLLCRDEHEADDLVQEALVRVFVKWSRVSSMDNPAGYAQRTLTNLYLSRWRRLRRDRSKSHLFTPDEARHEMEAVTERAALRTWLGSLGAKQRAAVVWRYYYDLPISEIATLLGCQESTVRTQLSRALTNIRRSAELDLASARRREHHDVP